MKRIAFTLIALLGLTALTAAAAKYKCINSAGNGYLGVTNGDLTAGPWYLFKDGRTYPNIKSDSYFFIDENNLMCIKRNGFHGLVDLDGKSVIPAENDYISYLGQGKYALIEYNNHRIGPNFIIWDLKTNTETKPVKGSVQGKISEGLIRFSLDGKWGFCDTSGRTVIAPRYTQALDFNEGLAAVKVGNKWGFINKAGRLSIPARYDHDDIWDDDDGEAPLHFEDGVAVMYKNGHYGVINKRGVTVIPFTRDGWLYVDTTKHEIYEYEYNGPKDIRKKIYNLAGKMLRTEKVDNREEPLPGLFIDNKMDADGMYTSGVIDGNGKYIIPKKYYMMQYWDGLFFCKSHNGIDIYDKSGKELYHNIADNCLFFMLP